MRAIVGLATAAAVLSVWPLAAQPAGDAARIAEAVQILPEDLRAGATVVTYDAATGARHVIRQGTNFLECQPRNPADGCMRPPTPQRVMSYRHYDKRDRIQNLWVWSSPNSTPESVGVSTVSQRNEALEGRGLPWMMLPGMPGAHITVPINK